MIRYDKKLNNEIRKVVNNYNSKIRRLENSLNNYDYIPTYFDKKALKSLKETSRNRKELRRRLADLKEFSARGGEKLIEVNGRKIPRYQYNTVKKYKRIATRKINSKIKFYNQNKPTYRGRKEKFSMAEQFDLEYQNLISLREDLLNVDIENMSLDEINKYINKLEVNSRDDRNEEWQKNYLDMLTDTGYAFGLRHEDLHNLREKLKQLKPNDFAKLTKTESLIKQIIYYYKTLADLGVDVAYENMNTDVTGIFNELFENVDDILKDYI